MPVAKLSREFYEKFGDKLTDELVNCLNSIELSYRAELRDLFDAHFGRFEEKLERRLSETKDELRREIASLGAGLRAEIGAVRGEIRTETGSIRAETGSIKAELTSLKADLSSVKERLSLLKWNFAVWVPVTLAVIGLYFKS